VRVLDSELSLAREMADRADEISMDVFRSDFDVREKPDHSPVTEADLAIEAMIRENIGARFPHDAVLGEEGGLQGEGGDRRRWIVDPIDGTKNFADGLQVWATLIALSVDERPVLGVVSAPALSERYEAVEGAGATLNGEPIHVSRADRIPRAFVVFADVTDWLDGPNAGGFGSLIREARRARGLGDFWGHVLVARGTADVMLEPQLATWDWAALEVVVREAGGRITTLGGEPLRHGGSVVSTNGKLHDEVLARLAADAAGS
jgi:histidinol-phosphatase